MPAVDKPKGVTSAGLIRDLQRAFNPSKLFAPWIANERAIRAESDRHQRGRRRDKRLNVKIGHGGTLDPLATGVLIIGIGKGTKRLQSFLGCTKSYHATLLFGAATDTYDTEGKVLNKAPYSHITRGMVEKALEAFRGSIMQRPPIFSALSVQGKRLYEYAREGKELPVEIQERPVTVEEIEITEWLEGGTHDYKWPTEEAPSEEKTVAEKVLHLGENRQDAVPSRSRLDRAVKRKRDPNDEDDDGLVIDTRPASKRRETDSENLMSGALAAPTGNSSPKSLENNENSIKTDNPAPTPPAVKLRMTVTSGFYVRSLCHDLGKAVGSLGIMSELVRTRQGEFELGRNTLSAEELNAGEDVWGPRVEAMLDDWNRSLSTQEETFEPPDPKDAEDDEGEGAAV